jgi:NitT/TauT family transport system substrate-binding protein
MLAVLLCGGALSLSAGCAGSPPEPIRIGVNSWPPFELLYLAREKGFFRDERVAVDLVDFSSYNGILRSYHQGNLDAFLATLNETLIVENFQDLPAAVLVADYSYGGDALVARDGIGDPVDLRGQRIAFEESALGSYMLERALLAGGLSTADVTAVNRLPEEGEQDFLKGAVDAVVTYEPALGRLLRIRGARAVYSSRDMPGEIVDVLVLRRAVLERRAEEARRILRAWFRAVDYFHAHPDESAALMAKRIHVAPEDLLAGFRGARIPDLEENRRLLGSRGAPGSLHEVAGRLGEFLRRHGLAKRTASGSELLHTELIDSL